MGEGGHLYVTLTREGMTTKEVQKRLAHLFHLRQGDIGYAGLKDKQARTTQTFSLPGVPEEDVAERIEGALPVRVIRVALHRNKLKVGHLLGNRFQITVVDPQEDALAKVQAVISALQERGLPNYFGPQRFGRSGLNPQRGREVLLGGGPPDRWLRRFLISAYQASLFNMYLARRIETGLFQRLLNGDVAKKTDTGGLFDVEDWKVEQPRFERGEITFTGPLFGGKMRPAGHEAGELERGVLSDAGLTQDTFQPRVTQGGRRPGKLFLMPVEVEKTAEGLHLRFFLPKGAYATVMLRELMKAALDDDLESDVGE